MSDWTEAELAALRRAYASGTLSVSYDGKSVSYGTATDRSPASALSSMRLLLPANRRRSPALRTSDGVIVDGRELV